MGGLFAKAVREAWPATVIFGASLLLAEVLLNLILPQIQEELGAIWLQMPFAKTLITALLGVDAETEITARVMQSIVWVHPVVLALVWAHEILLCTRFPAGEIDRGTIDVLLGLPVSRRAVFLCESAVWIASGLLLLALAFVGFLLGALASAPEHRPAVARIVLVLVNLFCVYVAIGGIALLVSALSDRRGRAVGIVFAIVLASFLLNFLAQFWAPADRFSFLSVLHYYEPAGILSRGQVPLGHVAVLVAVGAVTWLAAGLTTARRSICTI